MKRAASTDRADRTRRAKRRDDDATRPVRTVFLKEGAATTLHRHDEPTAWIHVISGEIEEERFSRDAEGGFVHERRVLRRDQSMAAPADTLHRVSALEDAAFVTTCACDCGCAPEAERAEIDAVQRLARTGHDRDWATTTLVGETAAPTF